MIASGFRDILNHKLNAEFDRLRGLIQKNTCQKEFCQYWAFCSEA
jgi:hypothetical protein